MKRSLQIFILIFFVNILWASSQTSSYYLRLLPNYKPSPAKTCADNQSNFTMGGYPINTAFYLYGNGNTSVPIASVAAIAAPYLPVFSIPGGTFSPGVYTLTLTSKDLSKTQPVKLPNGLVTIDGLLNEPYSFDQYSVNGTAGPNQSPVGITYATLWDDNYLYIAAKFIDNTPFPSTISGQPNSYQYDSFELYYDPLSFGGSYTGCSGPTPCGLVKQLRVGMNSNTFDSWPNASNTTGIQVASATLTGTIYGNSNPTTLYSGNGWGAEFKIPWSTFFGVATIPGVGFSFGFLIAYNDNINGTGRANQIFSSDMQYPFAWNSSDYSTAARAVLGGYLSTVTGLPFTARGEVFLVQDTFNLTVLESPVLTTDLILAGDCSSGLTISAASSPALGSKEIYYWQTSPSGYVKSPSLLASVPYSAPAPVTLSGLTLKSLNTVTGCWSAPKTFEFIPTSPGQYLTPAIITNYLCTAAQFISTVTGIPNNLLFWQTTSTGTSTANSSLVLQSVSGINVLHEVYLRAENTLTGCWSNGAAYASAIFTGNKPLAPSTINGLGLVTCVGYGLNYLSTVPSGTVWYWQLSTVTAPVRLYSSSTFVAQYAGDYYLESELKGCWSDTVRSFSVSNTGVPDLRNVGIDAMTPACEKAEVKISSAYTIPPTLTLYWEFNSSDTIKNLNVTSSILVTTPGLVPVYIRAKDQLGCWSPVSNMAGGSVFINTKPGKPSNPVGDTSSCTNITVSVSTLAGNFTYYWENSEVSTGDSLIAANTRVLTQSGTYFVRSRVNDLSNCWSDTATMIKVTIESKPARPVDLSELKGCGVTTITSSVAQPVGVTYFWELNDSSKALNNRGQNFMVNKQGTNIYYVRARTDKAQCWSDSNMITVTIGTNTVPGAPVARDTTYIHNDLPEPLTIANAQASIQTIWYTDSTAASASSNAPIPNTEILGKKTYYVSLVKDYC
jgi:hypothetical protein